jgi:hypothetical protein
MIGSLAPAGGTATITVYSKRGTASPIVNATVAASTQVSPPVSIPGWAGQYALGSVIMPFANTTSTDADEQGSWSAPVPNNTALIGLRLPIQALAVPSMPRKPALTNTTYIEVY